MNVREIVMVWLKENGCDGLCMPDEGCGCTFDDFMPCGEPGLLDCVAGYEIVPGWVSSERPKGQGE